MEIKNYKNGDEVYILELFQKVFGKPMSKKYWKWRFEDNPAGKHMIKLMWDGDTLAGHYAVSPVIMRVQNKIIPTALSMTTMTNPDYAGQGVFGKLAKALNYSLYEENGIKVVWGFRTIILTMVLSQNCLGKNIGVCHEIGVDINLLKSFDFKKVIEVDKFNENHINLFNNVNKNHPVRVNKTVEYLTWRYINHPSQNYRIFQLSENEELLGFVVSKIYKVSEESWIINLIELATVSNINVIGALLQKVANSYEESIQGITTWLSLFDNNYPIFEKIGFTPTGNTTYLGFRNFTEGLKEIGDFKNWSYSFGDSDVY